MHWHNPTRPNSRIKLEGLNWRWIPKNVELKKPSSNDMLLTRRTMAFERGDMAVVEACDRIQERRRASKRAQRARKKVRKAELASYVARNHGTGDPSSDNE